MRKILFLSLLLMVLSQISVCAQRDSGVVPFEDRLWYGAGLTGNFFGNGITSNVQVGIAPMVGYKLTDNLSFGPRISALVSFYKTQFVAGQIERINPMDWSVGLFSRYRIAREFFAQAEYAFQNEAFIFTDASGLRVDREVNNAFWIGGGYSARLGNQLGLEMSLNYYLNQPFDDFRNPLNYRFGINYRF